MQWLDPDRSRLHAEGHYGTEGFCAAHKHSYVLLLFEVRIHSLSIGHPTGPIG